MEASGRPTVLHWTASTLPPAGGKGTERQGQPAYLLIYAGPGFLQWLSLNGGSLRQITPPGRTSALYNSMSCHDVLDPHLGWCWRVRRETWLFADIRAGMTRRCLPSRGTKGDRLGSKNHASGPRLLLTHLPVGIDYSAAYREAKGASPALSIPSELWCPCRSPPRVRAPAGFLRRRGSKILPGRTAAFETASSWRVTTSPGSPWRQI
jgi:hypothetical protein